MKKLTIWDLVTTLLTAAIAVPYIGYLVRGTMPFIQDARGMAATGLVLGAAAVGTAWYGLRRAEVSTLERTVVLGMLALGVVALGLAETFVAETMLAVFMAAILVTWAVEILEHTGVISTAKNRHVTH